MIVFSELNLELIIDEKLARLSGCSLDLLYTRRTLAPLPHLSVASDKLVQNNVLLKDFLVCHNSHMLQLQALYIFHFDERTTNELDVYPAPFLYELKNY